MDKYILVDGQPVQTNDLKTWNEYFRSSDKTLAKTKIGDIEVVTVFLALDCSRGSELPILYETMVFGGELDDECDHYSTKEEAIEGHQEFVDRVSFFLRKQESNQ